MMVDFFRQYLMLIQMNQLILKMSKRIRKTILNHRVIRPHQMILRKLICS